MEPLVRYKIVLTYDDWHEEEAEDGDYIKAADVQRWAREIAEKPQAMQDLMRRHGLKLDNLDDPMQKLAFTFYTELCELASYADALKEVGDE